MPELTTLPVTTKKASDSSSKIVIGAALAVLKTSAGTFTLLPAVAHDRFVTVYAVVTEVFAANTGTKPVILVGQGDDTDKFSTSLGVFLTSIGDGVAPCALNGLAAPNHMGILTAGQPLVVTATAAVGDATGGVTVGVMAISLPA